MQRPLSFLIELALGCPRARRGMELGAWPRGYSGVSTEVAEDAGEDGAARGEECFGFRRGLAEEGGAPWVIGSARC